MADQDLLSVAGLGLTFGRRLRRPGVRALDEVSLRVSRGQTVGVVGESGSGKTTLGRAILGLLPVDRGRIIFAGTDVTDLPAQQRSRLSERMQAVFQDPNSSLNPRRTIEQNVAEPLQVDRSLSAEQIRRRVGETLDAVGVPASAHQRYPGQFSGGQRQRVSIARALVSRPSLVVCDEAVSSLDVSVQAQVLNLLIELQRDRSLSYLFITHNLSVVHYVSDWIVVMRRGRIVESGPAEEIYRRPQHAYTQALLAAEPMVRPRRAQGR